MSELYPEIEPSAHGMLDVGDGHLVYWESCGNPLGKPALVLHGGPGSGADASWRRFFDPAVYRVVLFDQRGCGRSTPDAGDVRTDLSTNTMPHLLADIEQLRTHLGIERWLLLGGSWGSALGLGYAQKHPDRVTEIVLFSVVTSTPAEHRWLTRDLGRIFPDGWERFRDAVPAAERDGNLPAAYARLLADPDETVRDRAARAWCAWEDALVSKRARQPARPPVRGPGVPDDLHPARHPLLGARRLVRRRRADDRHAPARGHPRCAPAGVHDRAGRGVAAHGRAGRSRGDHRRRGRPAARRRAQSGRRAGHPGGVAGPQSEDDAAGRHR